MALGSNHREAGQIIWHDLFSSDRDASRIFYERLAGWHYAVEHATDFAWGGGEKEFVLALRGGEAGAGLIAREPEQPDGWLPYVEVQDVDATAERAVDCGGTVIRDPFDVPGVGRNCLLRDPCGALIGVSMSRHPFPAPVRQFGKEVYLTGRATFPGAFYQVLFDWREPTAGASAKKPHALTRSGEFVAQVVLDDVRANSTPRWLPGIRTENPIRDVFRNIRSAGGTVLGAGEQQIGSNTPRLARDSAGALFHIILAD